MAISYDKLFRLLEKKGITTYYLRQNKIMGQQTYYNLKNGKGNLGTETLEKLCNLLNCQPGDLMEYVPQESLNSITTKANQTESISKRAQKSIGLSERAIACESIQTRAKKEH